MLGLTLPDAIALGSLFIAGATMGLGLLHGGHERAKNDAMLPFMSTGAAMFDRSLYEEHIRLMRDIATAIRETGMSRETRAVDRIVEQFDTLFERLRKLDDQK